MPQTRLFQVRFRGEQALGIALGLGSYDRHHGCAPDVPRIPPRVDLEARIGPIGSENVMSGDAMQSVSKISVAMATYNGAAYLEQQLESLANQVLHPGELVITDDGSSDGALALIEDFVRRARFP